MIGLSECVEDALIEGAGRRDIWDDRGGGAQFQRQGLTALREFALDRLHGRSSPVLNGQREFLIG